MTDTDGLRVFISYSHGDEDYRLELEKHLAFLKNQGVLSVWQDRQITAGEEFNDVIARGLEAADIVLLLISVDFLASKYCWQIELKRAMERHEAGDAKVIPVILRDCDDWSSAPFGKLTAAPTDGKPVDDFPSWDKGFTDVVRAIRLAVTELNLVREAQAKHQPKVNEPAPGPASGGWYVPHERNLFFTGRAELLDQLHRELSSGEPAALVQALSGLGGIGKSQTAIEYAYRHKDDYRLVWWLRAEEPAALAADYASMAPSLGLAPADDQSQVIAAVRDRLDQMDGWLLIFDNAREASDLRRYLPLQRRGRVIITSRNPNWGGVARPVRVEVMGEEDAASLLLRHREESEADDAKDLAEALGFLPLALAQARAYCEHVGCSLRAYLELLKAREAELLAQPHRPEDYDVPVAAAWDLAFETIKATPGAADLLNLLAYLAPDAFPKNLLAEHADELQDDLATVCRDPFELDGAIAALRRASLVEATDDTLSTHRLVQAVARHRCQLADLESGAVGTAIHLVNASLPLGAADVRHWPVYGHLLAHATTAADHAERLELVPETTGRVLNQIAIYLKSRVAYGEALPLHERALAIKEKALGPDHPNVAITLNNMANLHYAQGRYDEALPLYERDLTISEKALGPNDPHVAITLNNMANLHYAQGRYDEALPLYERDLTISEKALGPDHPNVAITLNNLAEFYHAQGRYDEALPLYESALGIGEKALGPDHPDVATTLNNLAGLYSDQGHYDEALPLYERALGIREQALGPDHPDVATTLNNLAGLYSDQGRYSEALPLYRRTIAIAEAKLPPDHPDIQCYHNNYEICMRKAGKATF